MSAIFRTLLATGLCAAALLCPPALALQDAAPAAGRDAALQPAGRFTYRSYGADHGLENVGVLRLLQDRSGFIWAGTEDGLYRFDGYRFDGFGLPEGLLSTSIDALHQDRDGVLWVGTHAGLSWYDGHLFRPLRAASGLPEAAIGGIADDAGTLFATTAQGPFSGTAAGGFRPMARWPGGEASAILHAARSHTLWIARWSGEASMAAWSAGQWRVLPAPAGAPKERIDAIAQDGDGRIWARSATSLWLLRADGARFELAPTPIPLVSSRGYLATGARGDLYVTTDRGLLHRVDGQWHITAPENGLPGAPWPVLEDREGSLWIGSVGLHRLLGRGTFHAFTTAEGLPYDVVWSIHRSRDSRLWVGTSHGLAVADGKRFRTIKGTENNTIRSIVEQPDGSLLLAGVPGNEILSYDPASGKLARRALNANNPAKRIFRLLLARDGALWASTDGAGLWRAPSSSGAFAQVAVPDGGPAEYMSDVREDGLGRIWVAGQNGVAVLDEGVWRRFGTRDGLRSNYVAYVRPLLGGDVLLPYFDPLGIARVSYDQGRLRVLAHYDAATTGSADKVYAAGEDSQGRLWIGGGRGIDMIGPEGTRHFGAAEGLIGEDIASMAFLADPGGDVWFGTTKGLVRFDQHAFAALPVRKPPAVTLLRIALDGKAYRPGDSAPRAQRDSTFEVRYAGISYVGEGKLQYRERLAGRESVHNVTDQREARYSGLQHGSYRFEVAARIGNAGQWGPETVFEFEVLPAWWQTWWFRTAAAFSAVLLLALAYNWRTARMRRENVRLEGLVAERTADLREANAALQESSMVDPLTGLKNRRYLGAFMPEELARTMRLQRERAQAAHLAADRNIDLCVLMVDLDHFKMVNDEHGHNAGDSVLRQVAEVMRAACRASDVVVRWGGEEFMVVARNIDRDQAAILAEQLCEAVRRHPFNIGNGVVLRKTCSIGYTAFPLLPSAPERYDWEQALELADQCMYAAKNSGRDGWVGCLVLEPGTRAEGAHAHAGRIELPLFGTCLLLDSWSGSRPIVWK